MAAAPVTLDSRQQHFHRPIRIQPIDQPCTPPDGYQETSALTHWSIKISPENAPRARCSRPAGTSPVTLPRPEGSVADRTAAPRKAPVRTTTKRESPNRSRARSGAQSRSSHPQTRVRAQPGKFPLRLSQIQWGVHREFLPRSREPTCPPTLVVRPSAADRIGAGHRAGARRHPRDAARWTGSPRSPSPSGCGPSPIPARAR